MLKVLERRISRFAQNSKPSSSFGVNGKLLPLAGFTRHTTVVTSSAQRLSSSPAGSHTKKPEPAGNGQLSRASSSPRCIFLIPTLIILFYFCGPHTHDFRQSRTRSFLSSPMKQRDRLIATPPRP